MNGEPTGMRDPDEIVSLEWASDMTGPRWLNNHLIDMEDEPLERTRWRLPKLERSFEVQESQWKVETEVDRQSRDRSLAGIRDKIARARARLEGAL